MKVPYFKTPDFFNGLIFKPAQNRDLKVSKITMGPADYAELRKTGRDALDLINIATILKTGYWADMWGAHIFCNGNQLTDHYAVLLEENTGAQILRHVCAKTSKWSIMAECENNECVVQYIHEA